MPYRLENYNINPKSKIGQQLIGYYNYCKLDCDFTEDTMRNKITSLNRFVRHTKLRNFKALKDKNVREWVEFQALNENKSTTINNNTKHIKAMVVYFEDVLDAEVKGFHAKKFKKRKELPANKRAFRREVVYRALRMADREVWLMIKIAFDCGLRIKELQSMRLSDFDGDIVNILGKGRKRRLIKLSPIVMKRLQDWIEREEITDWIWKSKRRPNRPKTTTTMRKMMRQAFAAADVVDFCPHELRYSYATDLKELGARNRDIQQGLGHSDERTTEHYLKDKNERKAVGELCKIKYEAAEPELY